MVERVRVGQPSTATFVGAVSALHRLSGMTCSVHDIPQLKDCGAQLLSLLLDALDSTRHQVWLPVNIICLPPRHHANSLDVSIDMSGEFKLAAWMCTPLPLFSSLFLACLPSVIGCHWTHSLGLSQCTCPMLTCPWVAGACVGQLASGLILSAYHLNTWLHAFVPCCRACM